jgi:hypothetical protein
VRDPPPCGELFAEGSRTNASSEAVREGAYCIDGGTQQLVQSTVSECAGRRKLVSNAWGWGFDGERWHAVRDPMGADPEAACTRAEAAG